MTNKALLAVLCAALVGVWAVSAAPALAPPSDTPLLDDGKAAKAFCSSPEFSKLSCQYNGLMGDAEEAAVVRAQCPLCGTLFAPLPPPAALPAAVNGHHSYNQWHVGLVSLACKGRAAVRAVFKPLRQYHDAVPLGNGWKNCTDVRLQPERFKELQESPVVRCELELPAGPEPEAQRAKRAKEGRCYVCTYCGDGGGCPSVNGRWYSDTYTATFAGCGFDAAKGFQANRVGLMVNPATELELAKLEVCNGPSCFRPDAEDAKLRAATRCVKGVC